MSDLSPVLALPFIMPAQAQKHVTHNEALRILDVLVQPVVLDRTLTAPPDLPQPGDRHIVASGATGSWGGQDGRIAVYETDTWTFHAPQPGWSAHVLAENSSVTYTGAGWAGAADQALRVAQLGVSAAPDATNRLTVSSPATLLSHAGAGHQLKINKAASAETASLLYQTGFSGRAEMGTAGSDDFSIKVSPDGTTFHTGLTIAAASGKVALPLGALVANGSAAAPSLAFTDSPGTGLYRPGGGQIGLSTDGTQRALLSTTALQVDVPVTGTAVQASVADATSGRLLRVHGVAGTFGLGASRTMNLVAGADLNTYLGGLTGFYRWDEAPANAPQGYCAMLNLGGYDMAAAQLVLARSTSAPRMWLRSNGNSAVVTPTPWVEVCHSGNLLGTVSQVAGAPTGRVIERGAGANGQYVRFADGTQICWITGATFPFATDELLTYAWTMPAAFAAVPAGHVTIRGQPGDFTGLARRHISTCGFDATTTTATCRIIRVEGARLFVTGDQITNGSITAIGRWWV